MKSVHKSLIAITYNKWIAKFIDDFIILGLLQFKQCLLTQFLEHLDTLKKR